ncbi:MAG: DUF5662 family protein [Longicatena sp.]
MHKFYGHLKTITTHKLGVTKLCFRCGLYKQGLLHDLSKLSFVEFTSGVKYFQGNRSPIDKEKELKGYSLGWFHHKGRNKHHWEYWLDNASDGIAPVKMPVKYVVEMYCDRSVASRIYMKEKYNDASAYEYFMNGYDHVLMHQETKDLLKNILYYQKNHGTDETIRYIRKEILHN